MYNILVNRLFILLISIFIVASPQSLSNLAVDLSTVTPTNNPLTQTPTNTASTPSQTYTPSLTPTLTATTTLMPLPEITLNFPVATSTPTITASSLNATLAVTPAPSEVVEGQDLSARIKFLSVVLVILWLILAGFLVIYIRQLK